jgi:ribosome-binding protein aMBF1 (putative translation factor)
MALLINTTRRIGTMGTENVIKLQTARKAVKAKALEITVERLTRIKARMSDLGFGQTDLANGIGASVSLINQMMSRKIRRTQHFGAIARVLQVNLPWLLAETNERIDMRDLDGNPISEEILPEMMASEEFRRPACPRRHRGRRRPEGTIPA